MCHSKLIVFVSLFLPKKYQYGVKFIAIKHQSFLGYVCNKVIITKDQFQASRKCKCLYPTFPSRAAWGHMNDCLHNWESAVEFGLCRLWTFYRCPERGNVTWEQAGRHQNLISFYQHSWKSGHLVIQSSMWSVYSKYSKIANEQWCADSILFSLHSLYLTKNWHLLFLWCV